MNESYKKYLLMKQHEEEEGILETIRRAFDKIRAMVPPKTCDELVSHVEHLGFEISHIGSLYKQLPRTKRDPHTKRAIANATYRYYDLRRQYDSLCAGAKKTAPPEVIINYRFIGYHGTRNLRKVCQEGLRITGLAASDPGDLGNGVYFFTEPEPAETYGYVVKVDAVIRRGVRLDWVNDRERSVRWWDGMAAEYGNPVNTRNWGLRATISRRWRQAMLHDGFDGILYYGWEGPVWAVVLYDPVGSIISTDCPEVRYSR